MGRNCIICGREQPNEAFSGRGSRARTCKKCRTMPKAERQRILDEAFLAQALEQNNISKKNVLYSNELRLRYTASLGEKAAAMAELGVVHPRKKKRTGFLYHNRRDLFDRMVRLQMIEDWMTPEMENGQAFGENIPWLDSPENMESGDDDYNEYIFEREYDSKLDSRLNPRE